MLTPRAQLRDVIAAEDIGLEVGKVDSMGVGSAHPAPRADLVSYKGRPHRFAYE
jgi:hypothetical protein